MQSLVDFPQSRECPPDIRRGLRALDPTAEVVYLGPRHWIVGRVRPNQHVRKIAEGMLDDVTRVLSVRAQNTESRRKRVALACLALQGFRPVQEYRLNDLDGRVVKEFQESQWRMLHTSDNQLEREWDAEQEAIRERNRRELGDQYRAADAYKTAFTSNFGYGVSSVAKPDHVKSGRVRHPLPKAS